MPLRAALSLITTLETCIPQEMRACKLLIEDLSEPQSSKIVTIRTAAVAYAVESLQVQHIIVLGHYGCKGAESAITMPQNLNSLVKSWIKPVTDLYFASRRLCLDTFLYISCTLTKHTLGSKLRNFVTPGNHIEEFQMGSRRHRLLMTVSFLFSPYQSF